MRKFYIESEDVNEVLDDCVFYSKATTGVGIAKSAIKQLNLLPGRIYAVKQLDYCDYILTGFAKYETLFYFNISSSFKPFLGVVFRLEN